MQSILKRSLKLGPPQSVEQIRTTSFGQYFYPIVRKKFQQDLYYSLEERLKEIDPKLRDPERYRKINIGFPHKRLSSRADALERSKVLREIKNNEALEKTSRERRLLVDLDSIESEWNNTTRSSTIQTLAEHFRIFEHLFGPFATFEPCVHMDISFSDAKGVVSPVYIGNMLKPSELPSKPEVVFNSQEEDLWTLILTNPDGNLYENEAEMLHWFVGNIPGNNVAAGEELKEYITPIPPKGTGYHRYVFVLYKQNARIDFQKYTSTNSSLLEQRSFKTESFYRENEDNLTPAGLSWFQADWDSSVTEAYYSMDMKAPQFLYEFPAQFKAPQKFFPLRQAFDRYLDHHRPEKELQERLLLSRLSRTHPIKGDTPLLAFPQAERRTLPLDMPIWRQKDLMKQWDGEGIYRDVYRGDDRPKINTEKQTKLPPWKVGA